MEKSAPAQQLQTLLNQLLPPQRNYIPVVTKKAQQEVIKTLDSTISNENFYFVFNLLTCSFSHINGVDKWLGYSSGGFTVAQYLNCIHPGQSIQFNMIALSMYNLLCKGMFRLQFSTQRYISLVALKHYTGRYMLFKKTTSVFQYDTQNRLLEQLNEFTQIAPYHASPLEPRIVENSGLQKDNFERQVFQLTLQSFMDKKYFSPTEFHILHCYAQDPMISSKQLAIQLKMAKSTLDVYNKRILQKARDTFTHPFHDAKEVAIYLKMEKIL